MLAPKTRRTKGEPKNEKMPNIPSGNRPVLPLTMCFPKNQPSPNSSSRSNNSTRSPFASVNSSELLA